MKKFAAMTVVAMLLSLFLNSGIGGLQSTAQAAPGDVIPLNANFLAALVTAGVDTDKSGTITQAEMAARTSLSVSGINITDITGIGYAVNLTSLSVTGTGITALPDEISALTKLTSLDLSVNALTGAGLPDGLWSLTGLTSLDLMMNDITTLPDGIGSLVNLQELNLYSNGLTALPDSIGSLTSLQSLVAHKNALAALPDSMSGLGSLETLTIWDNRLTSLPEGVLNGMTALDTLDVANNYLNPLQQAGNPDRTLIDSLINNRHIFVIYTPQHDYALSLDLKGGTLSGSTPKPRYYYGETVTLPAATKSNFVCSGWDLDGDGAVDVPVGGTTVIEPSPVTAASVSFQAIWGYTVTFRTDSFGTIDGGTADVVQRIDVGNRVASVPDAQPNPGYDFLGWYDGSALVTAGQILAADITSNRVFTAKYEATGTIHFADAGFGEALIAAGADDNGDGFVTTVELAAVPSLDLSTGQFESIAGIGGATSLQSLTLGAHGFTALPDEIGSLANLQSLDISGNPLTALPSTFANLTQLEDLNLSNCAFASVPDEAAGLPALKSLDLSGNGISALPAALVASDSIQSLDLSGNLITAIPDNHFSGMSALAALDLSGNYLNPDSLPAGLPAFAVTSPQTTYAVTYSLDGGSFTGDAPKTDYWYGESIPLPEAARDESIFVGWDIDGDGTADTTGAGTTALTPNPPDSITGKTYTAIYISQNARLSGVGLSAGAYVLPAFDPESAGCTVTLYDYVGTVTITPQTASSKATYTIDGEAVPSIDVALASSSASQDVVVDVTAEDGTTTHAYTIHVVRAPAVDLRLKAIGLSSGVTRSPVFNPAVTAYTVLMPTSISTVTISATRYSSLASLRIDGVAATSRAFSVGLGSSKVVNIVVSAPLNTDKTKTYTLTLRRATTVSGFTAVPKVGSYPTLSPGGTNRMTFSYRMGGPGTAKIEVYKSGRWYAVLTRAETAGLKSWAWDGKVSSRYLAAGTYKVRITPIANGMAGTAYTLTFKIVKYPTVTWRSYASTFRARGTTYALCTFKVNYPTNATVRIYNSRGRIAAIVRNFTNLPPSKYYSVTWNGRATAGNTAGLASGALVPTGTYTLRIIVGPKYYYKTIKITR